MSSAEEDVVARASARLGTVLNAKYHLRRILGIGGMATVYAATHRNGKEFAVKVLHADLSIRADARTRFLREGYLANRVSHPGAVAVLDDDVTDAGEAFLVMELLTGMSVESLWEREGNALPLPMVAGIGLQLLDVLAAAHGRGLVHRDIKPGNLMLTIDGQVKVLDFGIARLRDMASKSATQTGMVMGTPAFMAPEHAMAKTEEIDAQTDVWAAGATLFTLASGLLVHEADNTQQLLVKAATTPARSFGSVMSDAPDLIGEVIDRALAFDKKERWASASAMRDALALASRLMFASEPTAASLAEMVEELGEHGATRVQHAPTDRPPGANAADGAKDSGEIITGALRGAKGAPRSSPVDATQGESPASAPPSKAAFAGPITAEAVATDSHLRRSLAKSRGGKGLVIAAGILVVGTVVALGLRATPGSGSSTAGSASHAPTATTPPSVSAAPSATGPAPAPWVPVSQPSPSGHAAVQLRPESLPAVVPGAPRPHAAPPAPVAPPQVSPAPPAAPAKPSCNPPYEFDETGNKKWKRECL